MRELLPSTETTATGCSERENDWDVGEERSSAECGGNRDPYLTQKVSGFTPGG
jgi:hypothetical protein